MNKCPECGSMELVQGNIMGEVACKLCGLVLDDSPFDYKPYMTDSAKKHAKLPYLSTAGTNPSH